jgi:hypothetical protein
MCCSGLPTPSNSLALLGNKSPPTPPLFRFSLPVFVLLTACVSAHVSAVRLFYKQTPIKVGRVGVHVQYQRGGYGSCMMHHIQKHIGLWLPLFSLPLA